MHLDSTFQLCGQTVMGLHGLLLASTVSNSLLGYKELKGKQGTSSQEEFLFPSVQMDNILGHEGHLLRFSCVNHNILLHYFMQKKIKIHHY